jgi:hypothetical protein
VFVGLSEGDGEDAGNRRRVEAGGAVGRQLCTAKALFLEAETSGVWDIAKRLGRTSMKGGGGVGRRGGGGDDEEEEEAEEEAGEEEKEEPHCKLEHLSERPFLPPSEDSSASGGIAAMAEVRGAGGGGEGVVVGWPVGKDG